MARRKRKSESRRQENVSTPRQWRRSTWWGVGGAVVFAAVAGAMVWSNFSSPDLPTDGTRQQRFAKLSHSEVEPSTPPLVQNAQISLANRVSWQQIDDPSADGWQTEVLHQQVKKQLEKLGKLLTTAEPIKVQQLEPLVTSDFRCGPLLPDRLRRVFEDDVFVVERSLVDTSGKTQSAKFRGALGLAEAMHQAAARLKGARDARFKFKVIRVQPTVDGLTTRQYLSLSGVTGDGVLEQNATWSVHWRSSGDGVPPRMHNIAVEQFERVLSRHASGPLFADCTEAALAHNACYQEQLLRGVNHWLERIPARNLLVRFGMPGIALGDINDDGLDDLYLCQEPGLPNRLFLQNPDGTLSDVAAEWGVNWLEDSRSALLVDLDNDGDQDLAVAILRSLVLARNEKGKRFEIQTVLPTSESTTSLSAVDYDRDGKLDLYVCAYAPSLALTEAGPGAIGVVMSRFVYHDASNGGANSLFRNKTNDAGWDFVDVTQQVGLDVNNRRWSFAAAWEDFDNDGDPDLYVANDYGRNNLYRNDPAPSSLTKERQDGVTLDEPQGSRTFVDVAALTGTEDSASGMSVSWGDYDRDGWMDVYIANMFSAAGNRIATQSKFKSEVSADVRRRFRRFARGNTLLRNLGKPADLPGTGMSPAFSDESTAAGVTMGRWAWSSNFVDLNNDGWEDLVVANGYITTDDTGDL